MMNEACDDEDSLARDMAQVTTRDVSSGGWVPVNDSGLSNISVRKRVLHNHHYHTVVTISVVCNNNPTTRRPDPPPTGIININNYPLMCHCGNNIMQLHNFLILGKRISKQTVVLSCTIRKDIQYNNVMPTFHHWRTGDQEFGHTFQTAADARAFDKGVRMAVEDFRDDNPIIRNRPGNVEADIGSNVTLLCEVVGNPEPGIKWRYERTRQVLSTGPWYTFLTSNNIARKYSCTPGISEVTAHAHFTQKGPPNVTCKHVQFGLEGATVRVECTASAIPRPDKVMWAHHGLKVDSGETRVSVLDDLLPDGVRSSLIIREALDKYFRSYICSVANVYGMDAAGIPLKKLKILQLLVILAGLIGGMVVISGSHNNNGYVPFVNYDRDYNLIFVTTNSSPSLYVTNSQTAILMTGID